MVANRVALRTWQARNTRNRQGEAMRKEELGDTGKKDGAEEYKDVTLSETTAEIEMEVTTSNEYSNPA